MPRSCEAGGRCLVLGTGLAVLADHLGRGVTVRHLLARVTWEDAPSYIAPGGSAAAGFRVLVRTEHATEPHDKARCDDHHDDDDAQALWSSLSSSAPSTTQPAQVMRPGSKSAGPVAR